MRRGFQWEADPSSSGNGFTVLYAPRRQRWKGHKGDGGHTLVRCHQFGNINQVTTIYFQLPGNGWSCVWYPSSLLSPRSLRQQSSMPDEDAVVRSLCSSHCSIHKFFEFSSVLVSDADNQQKLLTTEATYQGQYTCVVSPHFHVFNRYIT